MVQALLCPLCSGEVAAASGCLECHLPMKDVVRYQERRRSRSRSLARALVVRVSGLLVYTGIVVWCALQLPGTLPFVVPGAVLGGGYLHVLKGRPVLGGAAFVVVVVVAPVLLLPALTTDAYSDLTEWIRPPE